MVDSDASANNPAGRVLSFLRELQTFNQGQSAQQHIMTLLAPMLGVEEGSTEAYRVVTEIREQIESVPKLMDDHSGIPGFASIFKYYTEIDDAAKKIQLPRSYAVSQLYDGISSAGWASLEFANEVLCKHSIEKRLSAAQAKSYLDDVQALIREIVEDETLSKLDRNRLVRLLGQVEDALIAIQIFGADHVEEAAVTVAGVVQVERDLWERIAGKKWVQRFGTVISGLLLALGATGGLPAIESAISNSPTEVVVVEQVNRAVQPQEDPGVVDGEVIEDDYDGQR